MGDEAVQSFPQDPSDDDKASLVPRASPPRPIGCRWGHAHDALLYRLTDEPPRQKVAGFDVDGTLLRWTCAGWPHKPDDYALWSAAVVRRLRALHADGFKLVLFGNRGGIKGAFDGANARKASEFTDWIAHVLRVPLHCLYATRKKDAAGEPSRFFKPAIGMWDAMEELLNGGVPVDAGRSFFVGDAATDREWAERVGRSRGVVVGFEGPAVFFGPPAGPCSSNKEHGGASAANQALTSPDDGAGAGGVSTGGAADVAPATALEARRALLGGYLDGPRMLLLCGPQGAGKSVFSSQLLANEAGGSSEGGDDGGGGGGGGGSGDPVWVHVSQDTISKAGTAGSRPQVERAARAALARGRCVVVDRMHLTAEQRRPFIVVAEEAAVPVDVAVLCPPLAEMQRRVRVRTHHPTGFQGGGRDGTVASSLASLQPPTYAEGLRLITFTHTPEEVAELTSLYRRVRLEAAPSAPSAPPSAAPPPPSLATSIALHGQSGAQVRRLPAIVLGTMNLRSGCMGAMLLAGFAGVDTAPTYKNEAAVGSALAQHATAQGNEGSAEGGAGGGDGADGGGAPYVIVKVPSRARRASEVREELRASLGKLRCRKCDLLLLHWPAQVIENGTLGEVWKAMEAAVADGEADALGVCNFTSAALRALRQVATILPAVNQVERHPMLPQWALLEACRAQRIIVQAHTPLGQGRGTLLHHPVVETIARQTGLSAAQLVLHWNLRHGVAVAPKCSTEVHAAEVLRAVAPAAPLSADHMAALDGLVPSGAPGQRWIDPPWMKGGAHAHLYSW